MAYTIMDEAMGLPKIAATSTGPWVGGGTSNTTPPLGAIVTAVDPTYGVGEFILLKGVASTIVGSVVTYNGNSSGTPTFQTTLAPSTANLALLVRARSIWLVRGRSRPRLRPASRC
jgi:hypothetical protein